MSKKKKTARACIRCGCTQDRACVGGCSWVIYTNVCTACLTTEEGDVYQSLISDIDAGLTIAGKQMKLFGEMITLGRISIPF